MPNAWIDLSGWSPKYSPPQFVQCANTLLKDRLLFESDHPLSTPERGIENFDQASVKDRVKPRTSKENAKLLVGRALSLAETLGEAECRVLNWVAVGQRLTTISAA